jgi:hypothetical protein
VAGGHFPAGLRVNDVFVLGIVAAIGFTVSLFSPPRRFPKARRWPKRRWARY